MVGFAQAMMGKPGAVGGSAASVVMSPAGITASKANGVSFSQAFTASVTGGVGPFTYAWSISGAPGFSLSGATTATCTVTAPGQTNIEKIADLTVTVTDTGNGNITCADVEQVDVAWGTPV